MMKKILTQKIDIFTIYFCTFKAMHLNFVNVLITNSNN